MKRLAMVCMLSLMAPLSMAQPASLDDLLKSIRDVRASEQAALQQRESRFLSERDQQQQLLREAEQALAPVQAEADRLKAEFDRLEAALAATEIELNERSGYLGELFGVVRQSAGDTLSQWQDSLLNVQFPERTAALEALSESRQIPTVEVLEQFWFLLQQDMTASGKVSQFDGPVVGRDGQKRTLPVVSVGPFVALQGDEYLTYQADAQRLLVAGVQPGGRGLISDFSAPRTELADLWVDPTRGTVIQQKQMSPSLMTRINQGGVVGYVIMALGVLGLIVALIRVSWLQLVKRRVIRQMNDIEKPQNDNPLGRVLQVVGSSSKQDDLETLELKLDEAILKETPPLESWQGLIKLLAAVAPLLGLLGTVTGMIVTFQAITLFGTGDPKLMADGISQALITTVQGLVVAIPLLFLHSIIASRSKELIQILEQQSAGMIALHVGGGERQRV